MKKTDGERLMRKHFSGAFIYNTDAAAMDIDRLVARRQAEAWEALRELIVKHPALALSAKNPYRKRRAKR